MASPMHMQSGVYQLLLASQFYKDFPVWLYHSVKGNPQRAPTWTPARTPAKTPICGARSQVPTQYPTPQLLPICTKTPPVFSPYVDLYEDFDMEEEKEMLDEAAHGPKFANPFLREVAVLSWRKALNAVQTPELFLSLEIVLTVMTLIISSLFKNLGDSTLKTINSLLNFYLFALVFFSSNDAVPTFIQEKIYLHQENFTKRLPSFLLYCFISFSLPPFFAIQDLTYAAMTKFLLHLRSSLFNFWIILYASLITTNAYVMLERTCS